MEHIERLIGWLKTFGIGIFICFTWVGISGGIVSVSVNKDAV